MLNEGLLESQMGIPDAKRIDPGVEVITDFLFNHFSNHNLGNRENPLNVLLK
jgi:hypothetical protein